MAGTGTVAGLVDVSRVSRADFRIVGTEVGAGMEKPATEEVGSVLGFWEVVEGELGRNREAHDFLGGEEGLGEVGASRGDRVPWTGTFCDDIAGSEPVLGTIVVNFGLALEAGFRGVDIDVLVEKGELGVGVSGAVDVGLVSVVVADDEGTSAS
jgi:hypothetical protein